MQVRTGRHGLAPFVGWNGVAVVEEATPARVLAVFVVPVAFPGSLGTVVIVDGLAHASSVSYPQNSSASIPTSPPTAAPARQREAATFSKKSHSEAAPCHPWSRRSEWCRNDKYDPSWTWTLNIFCDAIHPPPAQSKTHRG